MQYRRQTEGNVPKAVGVREIWSPEDSRDTVYQLWRQLRYGENPGQTAAVYTINGEVPFDVLQEHHEKSLSYTNVMNADMSMRIVRRLTSVSPDDKTVALMKHTGPCGVARYPHMSDAFNVAWNCDPEAAFGSVDGFSHEVDEDTAQLIVTDKFVEAVIAPAYTDKAREVLASKPKLRVLRARPEQPHDFVYRPIDYGHLAQQRFVSRVNSTDNFEVVSKRQPEPHHYQYALFTWQIVPFVLSNAIVIGRERYTSGICGGQPHRNRALRWAAENAKYENINDKFGADGAAVSSDAFIPFKGSVKDASRSKALVLVAPLGSERDAEVIAEADKRNLIFMAPFYINDKNEKIYERAFSH